MGRDYYQQLCNKFHTLLNSEGLMAVLRLHWNTYVKKYHKTSYYRLQHELHSNMDVTGNESNDDDCIVSLPGDVSGCNSDDESDGGSNKRQRLVGV